MSGEFKHYSVLLAESINGLNIKENGTYADGTTGGGGHSLEIAKRLGYGRLICVDTDSDALSAAKTRLEQYKDKITFVKTNFSQTDEYLKDTMLDGMIIDLGVSSYQLDTPERGFSYMQDAPLDMRMDRDSDFTCEMLINEYERNELVRVFRDWGEEKFAQRIADNIIEERKTKRISRTSQLSEIVRRSIPKNTWGNDKHPEKRVFQACRIECNKELDVIEPAIRGIVEHMNPGARLCIITFHSLEDRIVKQTFADLSKGCTCPPDFPVCVCNNKPKVKIITKKPILPSNDELSENSRSKSAKLRICEKI